MKRILFVFLAVISVAVTGFSQELKFDGYLNSGLGWWMSNHDGTDSKLVVYGVDSERAIGRFRLNGAFTNAGSSAGVNFRIQAQGSGTAKGGSQAGNAMSLAFGYAWIKPFDMLTIKAGLVDDATWQTADVIYNDDQTEGAGVLLRLTPVSGLDFGAGAYVASYNSSGNDNFLDLDISTGYRTWNDTKYTFYGSYTMDKVFRLMLSGRIKNATGGDLLNTQPSQLLGEFRLLAVPNLTAVVVGRVMNVADDYSDTGLMQFFETLGYKVSNLSFGFNAAQYVSNSSANKDLGLHFNPWIAYALKEGKVVPRLDFVYFMGGKNAPSPTYNTDIDSAYGKTYQRRGFSPTYNSDDYVYNVRPSVKINLDAKTAMEFGDAFYYSKYTNADSDPILSNVLYMDMTVKF